MATFSRTETIVIPATVRNINGNLATPATSMKITVTNPDGTAVVDNQAMVNLSAGQYEYRYTPAITVSLGVYGVKFVATDGSEVSIAEAEFFLV